MSQKKTAGYCAASLNHIYELGICVRCGKTQMDSHELEDALYDLYKNLYQVRNGLTYSRLKAVREARKLLQKAGRDV